MVDFGGGGVHCGVSEDSGILRCHVVFLSYVFSDLTIDHSEMFLKFLRSIIPVVFMRT